MRIILLICALAFCFVSGCDLLAETADDAKTGVEGGEGLADKLSKGTVGDADPDTGESPSDEDEADDGY